MIVDDAHALLAVLTAEANATGSTRQPQYLDARVPSTLHLRLVSALHKPTAGRLSRLLHGGGVDAAHRAALLAAVAEPRRQALRVLDDRLVAGAIGPISAEPGVSIAFAALIAHAHSTGRASTA